MTRGEAEQLYAGSYGDGRLMDSKLAAHTFINMLEKLGVLKLDDPSRQEFLEAGKSIEGIFVGVMADGRETYSKLTLAGGYEVLDALRQRGWKVVRK